MKALTRESILNAKDIVTQKVECPEWGGYVYIKALSAKERDDWETSLFETKRHGKNVEVNMKRENIRARLVARTAVDKDGQLLFTVGDIEILGTKSAAAMDRLFDVAQKLSGLSEADVDELEKNLNADQADT